MPIVNRRRSICRFFHRFRSLGAVLRRLRISETTTASILPFNPKFAYLPSLPAELWVIIIREAAAMSPDLLDVSHGLSFLETTPCHVVDYFLSMRNKCSFALVSKSWNCIVQPLLYEVVWISRASQAKALARTILMQHYVHSTESSGQYIRRLHIETPGLKRCAPDDIRAILDHAPHLIIYSDHRSVRSSRYSEMDDLRCSPEQTFSALAHPNSKLRRLSLTNYGDDPFPQQVSPMLQHTAANLEYLELCSSSFPLVSSHSLASIPSVVVDLPLLQSLKLTLDNVTFAVLASWNMPSLQNLSVVSSDFSYTGPGFSRFFIAHGSKLRQLELGHSSSLIEQHYLTMPPILAPRRRIPLAEWCPNLREFICSADAEWNWQNPDWIAPHILLPTHPGLEFIGIRDIDKRLLDDADSRTFDEGDASPFFPLVEQLSTLLHSDAFPSLRFIRDLSRASHDMRSVHPQRHILEFWNKILERCRERHIWLEDYQGVNITHRDLSRAALLLKT